jgi:plastocyanin
VLAFVATLTLASACGIGAEGGLSSSPGPAHCEVTPQAVGSATVTILHQAFGDPVTISAGDAVAFDNRTNTYHTITEGTQGKAAADACVNMRLPKEERLILTFDVAGDYPITCRRHPSMHTTVHVMPTDASPSPSGSGSR